MRLLVEELDCVIQEALRVLVLRSVPGIGIDDQLGVRYVLRQMPGVDRSKWSPSTSMKRVGVVTWESVMFRSLFANEVLMMSNII